MDYTQIEKETFFLINQLRAEPHKFIAPLEKLTKCFKGKTYKIPGTKLNIVTAEGVGAVSDAIIFLKVILILPPIQPRIGPPSRLSPNLIYAILEFSISELLNHQL